MRLKIIALSFVFLLVLNILLTSTVGAVENLEKIAESADYGGTILGICHDNTYTYCVGVTTKKIYQLYTENLTKKAESIAYGGTVYSVATDGTYVYMGGDTTFKVYQFWTSNMTKKTESANYGGIINALSLDSTGTYIYAGGSATKKVYQYWTSNMSKKAESGDYGGTIQTLSINGSYIFGGGATTNKVYQYWTSNLSKKAESLSYGGAIERIASTATYVYAGGGTTKKVYQYWTSNLTKKAESADYGATVRDIVANITYVWAAGDTTARIYQYWISNMSKKAQSELYGGNIRCLDMDSYYLYAGGETTKKVYKYWRGVGSWTGLTINVYDEETNTAITGYNVTVVNYDGSAAYVDHSCINPTFVDPSICPQGQNIRILVTCANYSSRVYLMDITNISMASLYVYLPRANRSNYYILQILNELNDPQENATVGIKRYINTSFEYYNITNSLTDSNGVFGVYLIPNNFYIVNIIKEGYETKYADYIPDPYYFGLYYPKTYILSTPAAEEIKNYSFFEGLSLKGTMYSNNTLKIIYIDTLNETINGTFFTYNQYNFTNTLESTNYTINGTFTFWVRNINTSRTYIVRANINHSEIGYITGSMLIISINYTSLTNLTEKIEGNLTDIFGSFDLGYIKFFIVYLPFIGLVCLGGAGHTALGVIGGGLWLSFSSVYFSLPSTLIVVAPFVIAIGIILFIVKGGEGKV